MKLELKTSFLFGLLIGLLLVLIFGKPRGKPVSKPAAKQEPARTPPRRAPESWRNRPGARTTSGKGRTIDVEADAEFEAETQRLDREAFAPITDVWESLASRKAKMEQQEKVAQS